MMQEDMNETGTRKTPWIHQNERKQQLDPGD
jgi:hypothetical protein